MVDNSSLRLRRVVMGMLGLGCMVDMDRGGILNNRWRVLCSMQVQGSKITTTRVVWGVDLLLGWEVLGWLGGRERGV